MYRYFLFCLVAEWPPLGKELLTGLAVYSLCIMPICNSSKVFCFGFEENLGIRIRIRIAYRRHAKLTIIHQGLCLGELVPSSHKRCKLGTQSSDIPAEEIRESGKSFQSLIISGKKLHVYASKLAEGI